MHTGTQFSSTRPNLRRVDYEDNLDSRLSFRLTLSPEAMFLMSLKTALREQIIQATSDQSGQIA